MKRLHRIGLAAAIVTGPSLAERFLASFASSAVAHYTEQERRLIEARAIVNFASSITAARGSPRHAHEQSRATFGQPPRRQESLALHRRETTEVLAHPLHRRPQLNGEVLAELLLRRCRREVAGVDVA